MKKSNTRSFERLPTGISGLDWVSQGGFPRGRATLVAGTAGSGKTIFSAQFLVTGIQQRAEPGVFVTFEETANDIRRNLYTLGWDVERWEKEKRWRFVDASPVSGDTSIVAGDYDLSALLARIEHAVSDIGAGRVAVDSLGALFTYLNDLRLVRNELHRMTRRLKELGVTTVLTAERKDDYGDLTRYNVEEFVADNVVILRNVLAAEKRRRTLEILKIRGGPHHKGEFPFTILRTEGVVLIPAAAIELKQKSSTKRISSGNDGLDRMCSGGFFRDSVVLVSGPTGTGKTLAATEFAGGGTRAKERVLFCGFEESREQLFRNARGWGHDFERLEKAGLLRVNCVYPEAASLEEHLIQIKAWVVEFRPKRVVIDSVSALERTSSTQGFREFLLCLTAFIKQQEITGMFTSTTPNLLGETSITDANISTITDSIILLRYVELAGSMRRGVTVLKMRGCFHDKAIREFSIDGEGMHIQQPFESIAGLLTGNPRQLSEEEMRRLKANLAPEPVAVRKRKVR